MSDIEDIKATVKEWNKGLDSGDIERMIASCDPDNITCNNGHATTIDNQAIRDRYTPLIAMANIKSTFD